MKRRSDVKSEKEESDHSKYRLRWKRRENLKSSVGEIKSSLFDLVNSLRFIFQSCILDLNTFSNIHM